MAETFDIGPTGKAVIVKDPNAKLDYTFDWTTWLSGDTITSVDAAITGGTAVIVSTPFDSSKVTVWVQGGAVGETNALRCRITTQQGRIDDRTVYIKIKER